MWDLAATKSSKGLKIATSENLFVRGRQPDLQNADILPAANRTNPKFTAAAGGPISTNIFRRGLNHQPETIICIPFMCTGDLVVLGGT